MARLYANEIFPQPVIQELLIRAFPAARAHLGAGEPVVELTSR